MLIMDDKEKIIQLFNEKVRNRIPTIGTVNSKHDGKKGHWLEEAMGIKRNGSNAPDLFGYEMKDNTNSKTTFGDWSADCYIFNKKQNIISRDQFLSVFGKMNPQKNNRYSWSGEPCPNIHAFNKFGQKLFVDDENNIIAIYSFDNDQRSDKRSIVPSKLQVQNLPLAFWTHKKLKKNVEEKFNQKGWFKCVADSNGRYVKIAFGDPISFPTWINYVKSGDVFFDSGMYQGNNRPYSQWRASNKFWDSLITSSY
jgi:hypothetical protein